MTSKKIVRISKTEFETDDGVIHPIPFELDEVPCVEGFQKGYDEWFLNFHKNNFFNGGENG